MGVDLSELEWFDTERAKPPGVLYKYVVPDRVDVLEGASIRVTSPLNTNDTFEVRQTFDLIMGPKMQAYFKEVALEAGFDEPLRKALDEGGLGFLSTAQAKALLTHITGQDADDYFRMSLNQFIDLLPQVMNAPDQVADLLQKVAAKQLLLSLSERADSSPMWAHYADNSRGFAIAFHTASSFFRRGKKGEMQGLHKVHYFDDRVGEVMDNPFAALVSKQADWSYEREWRLYARAEDVAQVLKGGAEDIHLVSFPREAVARIILGLRASPELERELRRILESDYPDVALMRLKADRSTAKLTEQPA